MIGLTRSMAKTLAPYGIRVNAIAPGTIDTPMAAGVDTTQMERQMYSVAMGRVGRPMEIATVVRFLAGDDASYMTGSFPYRNYQTLINLVPARLRPITRTR